MKMEVKLYSFLTSTRNEGQQSASCSGHSIPR